MFVILKVRERERDRAVVCKFKMAAGDTVSIRGQAMNPIHSVL